MKYICASIIIYLFSLFFTGCKKEFAGLSVNADEIFWVTNNGADMPVRVEGNTASHIIILIIHGGPGDGSFDYADYKTARLREKYAVAFWDQRNAGSAAGNSNLGKLNLPQMIGDLEAVVKVLELRYKGTGIYLYAHSFGGLLAAGYLVKDSNQYQLKGWIDIDGAHSYPLCDTSSRKMLIDTARSEIDKGNYVSQWQNILNYCDNHDPHSSYAISSQTESYAHMAEEYMGIKRDNSIFSLAEDPSDQLLIITIYIILLQEILSWKAWRSLIILINCIRSRFLLFYCGANMILLCPPVLVSQRWPTSALLIKTWFYFLIQVIIQWKQKQTR